MKTIFCYFLFFLFIVIRVEANSKITLKKTKNNGKEKIVIINQNKDVKVYYLSENRLSFSDKPGFIFKKQKKNGLFFGYAEGKLIEIKSDYLLVRRYFTKDLIKIPVDKIYSIGKDNLVARILTFSTISIGTLAGSHLLLENASGKDYPRAYLYGSFLVAGSALLTVGDKMLFPTRKTLNGSYKIEVTP